MSRFLKSRTRAFDFAFSGLKAGFLKEEPLKIQVTAMVVVVCAGAYYTISPVEWALVVLCCSLVISAELINTALEKICDLVAPQRSPQVKYIKDLGAAAVLVLALAACMVAGLVFKKYIFH